MKIPRQMRLSKHLLKHPGTWILGALIAVGVAMLVPFLAPALVTLAAVLMGIAAIAFIPYAMNWMQGTFRSEKFGLFGPEKLGLYEGFAEKNLADNFFKRHPAQGAVVLGTATAFIVALVLTIGFFTGGASFAFMAPVFSAISAPFAMATAAAHISLSVPALAGFCFIVTPLVIGNYLKRFLGWLDSFKYDLVPKTENLLTPDYLSRRNVRESADSIMNGFCYGTINNNEMKVQKGTGYIQGIIGGMKKTLFNNLSSPYEEAKDTAYYAAESLKKNT